MKPSLQIEREPTHRQGHHAEHAPSTGYDYGGELVNTTSPAVPAFTVQDEIEDVLLAAGIGVELVQGLAGNLAELVHRLATTEAAAKLRETIHLLKPTPKTEAMLRMMGSGDSLREAASLARCSNVAILKAERRLRKKVSGTRL